MSERLSDDDVGDIIMDNRHVSFGGRAYATAREVVMLANEVKERRARDLSSEEREALIWLAEAVRERVENQRIHTRIDSRHERGLTALAKLLGTEGER